MSGRPAAYPVYLMMGLASAVFLQMIYTPLAVYYVQVVHLNPLQLVLVGVVLELTELVFEVPTGVVADTYSRRGSIITGECMIGIAFIIQGLTPLFGVILLGVVLHGIGGTFISGALQARIADELGGERVRNAFGTVSSAWRAASPDLGSGSHLARLTSPCRSSSAAC